MAPLEEELLLVSWLWLEDEVVEEWGDALHVPANERIGLWLALRKESQIGSEIGAV
jgi:hypothetical protein